MEAGPSCRADGESSGKQEQQQLTAESSLGSCPSQQPPNPRPVHRALGRLQNRQPKRSDLLLRLQQQQAVAWQHSDSAGPSGGSFFSSASPIASPAQSSTQADISHSVFSHSIQENQEGIVSPRKGEKKPQKPGKYVCTFCGRPCAKPSVLEKHIRSHTGERPYPCAPCGFSFKTKSNLYKHRKSHAHRIKAGLASSRDESSISGPEGSGIGVEQEEHTEGESTESEEETGQHKKSSFKEMPRLHKKGRKGPQDGSEESLRLEDSQAVKQRLALRLSERKRGPMASPDDPPSSLSTSLSSQGTGSKCSTESGYFSGSGSTDLCQVSPPSSSAKTYAEIILGKYGRLGGQQRSPHQQQPHSSHSSSPGKEDKGVPFSVPKTQVIEHITKLITINEAVVDTREIDSVKPRRSSLSRKSSMESPIFSLPKDPYAFDPREEAAGPSGIKHLQSSEAKFTSTQVSSALPLFRSQSVPSSTSQEESTTMCTRGYRLCQSFDEQQAVVTEMRASHSPRVLRRQPAIEDPLGAETLEDATTTSSSARSIETGTQPLQKPQKGPSGSECEACGACFQHSEGFNAHKSICQAQGHEIEDTSKISRENRPLLMHYKFRALAMALRKRRKEESLEEDPPSPGPVTMPGSTVQAAPVFGRSEQSKGVPGNSDPNQQQHQQDRKGVSVIQHTSSFEKQESASTASQKPDLRESKETPQPKPKPSPSTSRLIRQPNIQVPEILVTGEPDTDMPSVSTPETVSSSKGIERVEEFQWPQRSHTLAQLPAEKLPPKKKRLRLAEASQSSGESSFESLPRSPSQERGNPNFSSPLEDTARSGQSTRTFGRQSYQMLMVPSTHQHHPSQKEMRRSASEQTPTSPQQAEQSSETRSKSFDYGALATQHLSSSWKDRRKYLLVQHTTLGEQEQEMAGVQRQLYSADSPEPGPSLSRYPLVCPNVVIKQPHTLPLTQDVLPLHPQSQQALPPGSLPRSFPDILSTQFIPRTFLPSQIRTPPTQLHQQIQLHTPEQLGLPPYQIPSLVPLQFSSSTRTSHALCLPFPTRLSTSSFSIREDQSSTSSLSTAFATQSLVTFSCHRPGPVIATCMAHFTPVVSLMVPVRLQTHIPTYASAIYTTLSHFLASSHSQQPTSCTSMVIVSQVEQDKLQRNYLKVPSPGIKSLLSISLPKEFASDHIEGYGSLGAGGSKRMLSPAASLELSTEAQRHQKRVKEEEAEVQLKSKGEEEKNEVLKPQQEEKTIGTGKKLDKEEKMGLEGAKVTTLKVEKVQGPHPRENNQENKNKEKAVVKNTGQKKEDRVEELSTPSYPSLNTSTSVNWCYLKYVKPNPLAQADPHNSVYSTWSVSAHNPNLPGFSTKVALSLLCSKQKHCSETYTIATVPKPTQGKVAPGSGKNPRMSEVHAALSSAVAKVKDEQEHKEEQKEKTDDEAPSTSKPSEPSRVRIFEGGYKSNEEYVYVRGRGRGKYICEECGIRCKKPSMLRKHIRSHTDVRPYICKHCNFAFKTKGNLTKHMKSKAHGKKCQSLGISESSLDEPESEETGDERVCGTEEQEEHQFSDVEHSDDDDDDDDEEDDEDEEDEDEEEESGSHEDLPSSCSSDTHLSTRSSCSQLGTPDPKDLHPSASREPSQRGIWTSRRTASPGSRRALFPRGGWKSSPRTFSPSSESCSPSRSLSPRLELSSPIHSLSPRVGRASPGRGVSPSPERGPSPIRAFSPIRPISSSNYRSPQVRTPPSPLVEQPRVPGYFPWENTSPKWSPFKLDKSGTSGECPTLSESSFFPSTFRLSTGESYPGHQTVDNIFSHLPMHSQQARLPYSMIPIGGIQMVQARPRSHPTTPPSPTSPPLEGPSLSRFESYWGGTSRIQGRRTLGDYKSEHVEAGSSCHALSAAPTLHKPESETTDLKQYGSSHRFVHTERPAAETPEHCTRDSHSSVTEQQSQPEQQATGLGELGTEGGSARTDQST